MAESTNTLMNENDRRSNEFLPWAALLCGLCVLYVPTLVDLMTGLWSTPQNAHGPIIFAVSIWFLIFKANQRQPEHEAEDRPAPRRGWAVLIAGILVYALGRSQAVYLFEVGSMIPVAVGVTLIFFGTKTAGRLWFAYFLMLFMIPLPGSVVDFVTQPMKIAVSWGAEHLLFWLGYPVGRRGVTLTIGQYQLLVADACSGLNSLFSLEALGLLYLNVTRNETAVRNTLLAICIIPISYASNLIRVVVLSLVTYYFGDEAGQGFLHQFSGMVLFLTALVIIVFVDALLRRFSGFWYSRVRGST
jgi:exosortase B